MWSMMWRPLAMVGAGAPAALAVGLANVRDNPFATLVMSWVLLVLAFEAVVGVGLIIYGVWRPVHRWADAKAAKARR